MNEAVLKELGLRAVATKHWRWMAGMKLLDRGNTYRLTYIWGDYDEDDEESGEVPVLQGGGPDCAPGWGWPAEGSGWAPDFSDPATLGCLIFLVRETLPDQWREVGAFMIEDCEWGNVGMIEFLVTCLE